MDTLPELLFSEAADAAQSKRVRWLAATGRLKKLYAGVYTSSVEAPPASVVLRNWRAITSHLLPQGVILYRSAFDGSPYDGRLVVTRGNKRRTIALPGLAIDVFPGPGPSTGGPQADYPYGDLYLSGEPRRFLENLTRGRGWAARALPQAEIEAQLEKMLALRG